MNPYELMEVLPVVTHGSLDEPGSFSIQWQAPDLYRKWIDSARYCPWILSTLEKCLEASMPWDIYEIEKVQVKLYEQGPYILIEPGVNGCYIIPHMRGMGGHNIDTLKQALALQHIFIIFLSVFFHAAGSWEESNAVPELDRQLSQPPSIELYAETEHFPVRVYSLKDEDNRDAGFVLARTLGEANQLINEKGEDVAITYLHTKPQVVLLPKG
jgi:hypothetical protein